MKFPNLSILLFLFVFSGCLQKANKEDTNSSKTDLNSSKIESKEKSKAFIPWFEAVTSKKTR